MMEEFSLLLQSSDDEAPEEQTFEDSRIQALRSMKQALDTARREKELLKEKRRRRQELFQEQKKRKLLPADVLEEISSAPSKKQKPSEDQAEEEEGGGEEEEEGGGEEEEEEQQEEEEKKSRNSVHTQQLKGNYTVTMVTERASPSFQQQTAEDFIQSRLYGAGSCRSSSNQMFSLHNKTGRNKSAAVQFVKKNWASEQKAKAEKLKKRWIHKQQVPS